MNSGAVVAGVLLLPDNRANIVTSVDGYGRKDRASTVLIPALASSWSGDKNEPEKNEGHIFIPLVFFV